MRFAIAFLLCASVIAACAFDDTLREYLSTQFWLPFVKHAHGPAASTTSSPFAGMGKVTDGGPLSHLRAAYQKGDGEAQALAAARAAGSSEEIELIAAKIDIHNDDLESARAKLIAFLRTAKNEAFRSEARGWLAHVYYRNGDQTAAGKIYLDELKQKQSNLSEETLLVSLRLTYGYDGGPTLRAQLDQYFDTPEHAAFAIRMATNPHWDRHGYEGPVVDEPPPYRRILELLMQHASLFRDPGELAALAMRTALRAGDPGAALKIAADVPLSSSVRSDPDFLWMLGSAEFLSHNYAAAAPPLVRLFHSHGADDGDRHAAAYALCGVYRKTGNFVEQIRFAIWLHRGDGWSEPSFLSNRSVYWAPSGWDIGLLLDIEAPIDGLRAFLAKYPDGSNAELVKYSLAVRLTREGKYEEAADIYSSIGATRRADRIRELSKVDGKFEIAKFLAEHQEQVLFNDRLWSGLQRYALERAADNRVNKAERDLLLAQARTLRDVQEERWQAYLLLRDIPGPEAARLARQCLSRISTQRFGREEEIAKLLAAN